MGNSVLLFLPGPLDVNCLDKVERLQRRDRLCNQPVRTQPGSRAWRSGSASAWADSPGAEEEEGKRAGRAQPVLQRCSSCNACSPHRPPLPWGHCREQGDGGTVRRTQKDPSAGWHMTLHKRDELFSFRKASNIALHGTSTGRKGGLDISVDSDML